MKYLDGMITSFFCVLLPSFVIIAYSVYTKYNKCSKYTKYNECAKCTKYTKYIYSKSLYVKMIDIQRLLPVICHT